MTTSALRRTWWPRLVLAGLAVALAIGVAAPGADAQTKVRFGLGWTDLGYFTPLFVAQQNGYFKQQNLDVTLTYGSGAAQAMAQTGANIFDMTVGDSIVGLKAVGSNVPITMVGSYGPSSIIAYVGLESSGITRPKDLEGKTLGGPPSDTGIVLLPAFAKLAGFDAAKVKVQNVDAGARVPALFQKRIDFLVSFDGGSLQIVETEARKQGLKPVILLWRDHGFNAMGMSIWANNEFAKAHPDTVRRFVRAAYQGVQFMVQNPEKAADIYTSLAATLDREATRAAVKSFARSFTHPSQAKHGLGYIDPAAVETTHDIAVRFSGLPPLKDLKAVYTNEHVLAAPLFP